MHPLRWIVLALPLLPALAAGRDVHALRSWQAQWQQLPAAERQQLQQAWQQYRQLPVAEQQALRQRFDQLDRLHREGWRLGPRLGAHWPRLQPLLAFVPASQRDPLLQALHGLDDASLARLERLSLRTPPEQRQALREGLLAQPAAQRGAWLHRLAGD